MLFMAIRFVHALPNSWLPAADKALKLVGLTTEQAAALCKGAEIISHVRYEDHALRISVELGIELEASGVNAPNPFNTDDTLIVATAAPYSSVINYISVSPWLAHV